MRSIILVIFCACQLSLFAQTTDSTATDSSRRSLNLQFKSPFQQQGDQMVFDLDLPGRRPIHFQVPKMLYAPPAPPYDPNVAWQRSIAIPGWGQYYNRQGWKIPFAYAGYGVAGYFVYTTHENYKDYQRAYRIRIQRDEQGLAITEADSLFMLTVNAFEISAPNNLKTQRDNFRQQRDRYILFAIGYHLFQTLDAYISAHLRDLDVSDELSLRVEPAVMRAGGSAVGMGVCLRF